MKANLGLRKGAKGHFTLGKQNEPMIWMGIRSSASKQSKSYGKRVTITF